MRFSADHYVPFLKGKQGEFSALKKLSAATRRLTTPLIDVPRVPVKNRSSPLDEHLDKQAAKIAKGWGSRSPIFVDLIDLPLESRTSAGQHHVEYLGEALAAQAVSAIPVTGADRDEAYQHAVSTLAKTVGAVGVRLLPEDIDTPSELEDGLEDVLDSVGMGPERTHLMIDLRSLVQRDPCACAAACKLAIDSLPNTDRFLTLTVAGSSMPQSLSEMVKSRSIASVPRKEVEVWLSLQRQLGSTRVLTFGDYGAVHPDLMDLDLTKITVAADIRYTTAKQMLIVRGSSTKHHPLGFGQYHGLAKSLTEMPEYSGRSFSWADDTIYRKAHRAAGEGPGNKTTWVQIATNHHIEFVVRELPALRASGASLTGS